MKPFTKFRKECAEYFKKPKGPNFLRCPWCNVVAYNGDWKAGFIECYPCNRRYPRDIKPGDAIILRNGDTYLYNGICWSPWRDDDEPS